MGGEGEYLKVSLWKERCLKPFSFLQGDRAAGQATEYYWSKLQRGFRGAYGDGVASVLLQTDVISIL